MAAASLCCKAFSKTYEVFTTGKVLNINLKINLYIKEYDKSSWSLWIGLQACYNGYYRMQRFNLKKKANIKVICVRVVFWNLLTLF